MTHNFSVPTFENHLSWTFQRLKRSRESILTRAPRHDAVHFLRLPDDNTPYGGIRVLYRCVDTLNAAGRSATIVHMKAGFRCT
jgi:hypothetical protein